MWCVCEAVLSTLPDVCIPVYRFEAKQVCLLEIKLKTVFEDMCGPTKGAISLPFNPLTHIHFKYRMTQFQSFQISVRL